MTLISYNLIIQTIVLYWIKLQKWYNGFLSAYLIFPSLYYEDNLRVYFPKAITKLFEKLEPYYLILLFFLIIIKIILNWLENKNTPSKIDLLNESHKFKKQQEILAGNIREIFKGLLFSLLNQIENTIDQPLRTNENINSLRISLYFFSEENFILIERASKNPLLGQRGRPFYPKNEGVIGMAWKEEWKFSTYSSKRLARQYKKDGITHPEDIKMQSLQIAALRLSCYKNEICTPIGLIVVETTKDNLLTEDRIKELLKNNQNFLLNPINALQDYIPKANKKED